MRKTPRRYDLSFTPMTRAVAVPCQVRAVRRKAVPGGATPSRIAWAVKAAPRKAGAPTRLDLRPAALYAMQEATSAAGRDLLDRHVELAVVAPRRWVSRIISDLHDRGIGFRIEALADKTYVFTLTVRLRDSYRYGARLWVMSRGVVTFGARLTGNVRV